MWFILIHILFICFSWLSSVLDSVFFFFFVSFFFYTLDAKYVIAFMNHSKWLNDVVSKLETREMKVVESHTDHGKVTRSTTLKRFKHMEVRVLVTNELFDWGLDMSEYDLVIKLCKLEDLCMCCTFAEYPGPRNAMLQKGNILEVRAMTGYAHLRVEDLVNGMVNHSAQKFKRNI